MHKENDLKTLKVKQQALPPGLQKLIYPTLDLFLYDLRDGLGQSDEEIKHNRHHFKQKLPSSIDENLFEQRDDKYFEPEYVELLEKKTESLILKQELQIGDGYYYPVRLSDSYGLLLDCSLTLPQSVFDLSWLKDLQAMLNEKLNGQTGTLGQTWMFSAQLPKVQAEEAHEAIAKRCYEALIPSADYADNKIGSSEFIGGSLFEFWRYTSPEQTEISENHHVIIALYPDETAAKKAALFYPDWMRLLGYRHKMMWAYGQSRHLKQRLKEDTVKIQASIKELSFNSSKRFNGEKLQQTLDKAWHILSRYTTELNRLDHQARTIEINQSNYQKRLRRIEEKAEQKLKLLEKLSETVRDKYLLQVQKDHASLSPELKLLENLIEYIRARVAIEEEKRDRSFQKTIATWGIALAAGAIVASISGHFPTIAQKTALTHPVGFFLSTTLHIPDTWLAPGISVVLSIGAAVMAGLVTKAVISWRQR